MYFISLLNFKAFSSKTETIINIIIMVLHCQHNNDFILFGKMTFLATSSAITVVVFKVYHITHSKEGEL